jgi:hypothetical protein
VQVRAARSDVVQRRRESAPDETAELMREFLEGQLTAADTDAVVEEGLGDGWTRALPRLRSRASRSESFVCDYLVISRGLSNSESHRRPSAATRVMLSTRHNT